MSQDPPVEISLTAKRIDQVAGRHVQGHGVDSEVPATGRLDRTHVWVSIDDEVGVTRSGRTLTAGQGHVDIQSIHLEQKPMMDQILQLKL